MKTTRLKGNVCPVCGKKIDANTCIDEDAVPTEGDISICFNCAAILMFDKDLSLIECDQKIFDELSKKVKYDIYRVRTYILANLK